MKDFAIETDGILGQMTFVISDDILNNIFLSLEIAQGSWFLDPKFGSRLHLLKKNTAKTAVLAVEYCKEALQWIIDVGRATSFDILAERDEDNLNRLNLLIKAYQANKEPVIFQTFIEVV